MRSLIQKEGHTRKNEESERVDKQRNKSRKEKTKRPTQL